MEQIVVDDFLNQRVADMIALGKVVSAILGTQTAVEGLACTPTSPASMDVFVAPGQIFFQEAVDTTTYGDLSPTANIFGHNVAANAATIMKQGLILTQTTFALTAPSTSGDSVNYLISAAYQDQDTQDVVLNYYNASNPSQPFQGPNNSGTSQPTLRQGKCVLTLTAGTAAPTGTQQTPAVPSGQVGLYVITVTYGQTSITSSSISVYPSAPFLSQKLFALMNGSGTVDVPALTASGLITANGGITVPSGETATVAGTLDVTGTATVPAATLSGQAVNLGQILQANPIGNSANNSSTTSNSVTTGSFTAPSNGMLMIQGNCAGTGGLNTFSVTASLSGLATNYSNLNSAGVGFFSGYLPMKSGQSTTLTSSATQGTAAPLLVAVNAFFLPTP